jgi:hypothetical protein
MAHPFTPCRVLDVLSKSPRSSSVFNRCFINGQKPVPIVPTWNHLLREGPAGSAWFLIFILPDASMPPIIPQGVGHQLSNPPNCQDCFFTLQVATPPARPKPCKSTSYIPVTKVTTPCQQTSLQNQNAQAIHYQIVTKDNAISLTDRTAPFSSLRN